MKNSLIKSFLTLSGSNLVAQIINLVTYFVLPRFFYTPEEFGVFGMFLPIYFILFELVNLKMDQSIMLPKDDGEANRLLNFSWATAVVFSISVSIILVLLSLFNVSLDHNILYFLGLSLLLGGLLQPLLVWFNRQSSYVLMGNIRIAQAVATFMISIFCFFVLSDKLNGLIIGFVGGLFFALLIAIIYRPKNEMTIANSSLINQYNQFIKYGTLSSMIGTLSRNLPAFAIKAFFGYTWLGYYTLATKYLNAPIGIFSTSIGQIYFKEASIARQPRLQDLTESIAKNIFVLISVPTILLLLFGGGIFKMIFGPDWLMAGKIIQVLILWYFIAYVSGPLSVLLDVKLKLKWELNYSVIMLIFRALALATAFFIQNIFIVLGIYAFVGIIFNGFLLNYILKLSKEDVE